MMNNKNHIHNQSHQKSNYKHSDNPNKWPAWPLASEMSPVQTGNGLNLCKLHSKARSGQATITESSGEIEPSSGNDSSTSSSIGIRLINHCAIHPNKQDKQQTNHKQLEHSQHQYSQQTSNCQLHGLAHKQDEQFQEAPVNDKVTTPTAKHFPNHFLRHHTGPNERRRDRHKNKTMAHTTSVNQTHNKELHEDYDNIHLNERYKLKSNYNQSAATSANRLANKAQSNKDHEHSYDLDLSQRDNDRLNENNMISRRTNPQPDITNLRKSARRQQYLLEQEQHFSDINYYDMNQRSIQTRGHQTTLSTVIKFISQLYFLIHLAVILSLLLHHRMLIANEGYTLAISLNNTDSDTPIINDYADYRYRRSNLNESSSPKLLNTSSGDEVNSSSPNLQQSTINTTSNDILVRLFGYSHARRFLYYALAYLLATSAIILLLIRFVRYVNNHDSTRERHNLDYCYPYFGIELAKSSSYHRIRLDCTPVLIACIALGLVQLANIGYNVANKIDLFSNQSRWPIYLAALHFGFVSLLTQYILVWVTTKHEQKRLMKRVKQQEHEKELSNQLKLSRLFRAKPIKQAHGTMVVGTIPIAANGSGIPIGTPVGSRADVTPSPGRCSSSPSLTSLDELGCGARMNNNQLTIDNRNQHQESRHRHHNKVITNTKNPYTNRSRQWQQLHHHQQLEHHPIRHGLHNIALAHILLTHLLLWLMDLNSIDLLSQNLLISESLLHPTASVSRQPAQPNHKVVYTVNHPPPPKTTSSRSLSRSQLLLDVTGTQMRVPIPVVPVPIIPMTQPTPSSAFVPTTSGNSLDRFINSNNGTDPFVTTLSTGYVTNNTWTPSDASFKLYRQSISTEGHQSNPSLVTASNFSPSPEPSSTSGTPTTESKPTSPMTTGAPMVTSTTTTTTSTTTTTPMPNIPSHNPKIVNNDRAQGATGKTYSNEIENSSNQLDQSDSEQSEPETEDHYQGETQNRGSNHNSRLPPPPSKDHNSGFKRDHRNQTSNHKRMIQKNHHLSTTPPSPMSWDSASETATRHELGDSGQIAPDGDLSQVLPARKRRVQSSLPPDNKLSSIYHQQQYRDSNMNKLSVTKQPETSNQWQNTTRPDQKIQTTTQPMKRKTAFKPIMTSRHINLTTNKPIVEFKNENQQFHDPYSGKYNHQQNQPRTKLTEPKLTSRKIDTKQSHQKRTNGDTGRPFPSLDTSEPAAWPSTVGTSTSPSATSPANLQKPLQSIDLNNFKQNQKLDAVKQKNRRNPKIPARRQETGSNGSNTGEQRPKIENEISNVIPVSRIRANQREQRAMTLHDESDYPSTSSIPGNLDETSSHLSQMTSSTTTPSPTSEIYSENNNIENKSTQFNPSLNQKANADISTDLDDKPESDTDDSDDNLDSELPPVPDYNNINYNDSALAPNDDADTGDSNEETNGGADNEEQLQQLNQATLESGRLSPLSQPLVANSSSIGQSIWDKYEDIQTLYDSTSDQREVQQNLINDYQLQAQSTASPKFIVVDYLHCIVGQFYILLAAILLNLWLDGLFYSKLRSLGAKCPPINGELWSQLDIRSCRHRLNRALARTSLELVESGATQRGQVNFRRRLATDIAPSSALVDSGSWSSPSLRSSQHTSSGTESYLLPEEQQARFLLEDRSTSANLFNRSRINKLTNHRSVKVNSLASSDLSANSQHMTACSLFAGLCVVSGAIASISMGIELISILTQCLTQLCTVLACLIGLCLIWRLNSSKSNNPGDFRHSQPGLEEQDHHHVKSSSRDIRRIPSSRSIGHVGSHGVELVIPCSSRRRLWQHKSSVYLEPMKGRSAPTYYSNSGSNGADCEVPSNKKTSGRQCFHYLFLLAAYCTGVSVALNLGAQYSMQQVFPKQVIQFISSHQQPNHHRPANFQPTDVSNHELLFGQQTQQVPTQQQQDPVSISHFNFLFHCILALKGLMLILQVTIQTVLIRCSCRSGQGKRRLRHIYTFLMFANLSLWAMEICSADKQQSTSPPGGSKVANQSPTLDPLPTFTLPPLPKTPSSVPIILSPTSDQFNANDSNNIIGNTNFNYNNNHLQQEQHFMSVEGLINFASSIVTLSHLYHGLIFI